MYNYDEVLTATLEYFNNDELATNVWMSKYCLKDGDSYLELTPSDMHKRMSIEFARIEDRYDRELNDSEIKSLSQYGQKRNKLTEEKIFNYFDKFESIIPQGSVMSSLGDNESFSSLSNCVVLPKIFDSYGGIMYTDQQLTHLYKRRFGAGINLSTLRPEGEAVKNSAKTTSGATSFMERFSNTTREVGQNSRRGALMETLDCRHPDILKFINMKRDKTKVTGANVSVMWTNDFLEAVEKDEIYILRFPVNASVEDAKVTKEVKAKEIWDAMVLANWEGGEPGFILKDRLEYYTTCHNYPDFKVIGVNPCAEVGMSNDSCRLIAINMFSCIIKPFTKNTYFDYNKWYKIVYESQRLMDDLVDLELEALERIIQKVKSDPEPEYIKDIELRTLQGLYKSGKQGRRTGLGITALGDTLAALGIKYDSDLGIKTIDNIMKLKMVAEFDSSIDMSIERGSFPAFDKDVEKTHGFWLEMGDRYKQGLYKRNLEYGRRNISISTSAPTGSLSMLAKIGSYHGTSGGVEPVFSLWFTRRKKINPNDKNASVDFTDDLGDKWQEFKVFHSGYKEWANINKLTGDISLYEKDSPYHSATSQDIDSIKRVQIQSTIQKYITHSISSTVNLTKSASISDISNIYLEAWKQNLKGITVYRDGSRSGVLITNETEVERSKDSAPKRPKELPCTIHNTKVKGEQWVVLIGYLDNKPYEVFAFRNGKMKDKTGITVKRSGGVYDLVINNETVISNISESYGTDEEDALTRLISIPLRHGIDPKFTVEQLGKSKGSVVNFSKAINRILNKLLKDDDMLKCNDCGEKSLVMQEGCFSCTNCGYSKCS